MKTELCARGLQAGGPPIPRLSPPNSFLLCKEEDVPRHHQGRLKAERK